MTSQFSIGSLPSLLGGRSGLASDEGEGGAAERLVEREGELARIEATLARACAGEGGIVLVEAPPGLGKTRLLAGTRERAAGRGMLVLSARAQPLERDFAFGLIRQSLEPVVQSDPLGSGDNFLFDGAAAPAEALFRSPPARVSTRSEFELFYGLYWLLVRLANERPLVLTLDDLHWADASSLCFVAFLLPRLQGMAMAMFVALRPREPGAEEELLTTIGVDPGAETLQPQPLSEHGVARLVAVQLDSDPDPEFCTACHEASAGNPFLLTELVREFSARALAPTAEAAVHVPRLGLATVSRAVLARLARLPSGAIALARAVTVVGDEAELHHAAALAELELEAAVGVGDALVDASILQPAGRLAFVHPLVRQAIYEEMAPRRRAELHRRAAHLLADERAEPDRIASHLLLADPARDRRAVEMLRAAARSALARAAPAGAVTYLRRALRETPPPDERLAVLLELGKAELAAGDPAGVAHLGEVLAVSQDASQLAQAAMAQGRLLLGLGSLSESVAVLQTAAEALSGIDVELARRVQAEHLAVARWSPPARHLVLERLEEVAHDTPTSSTLGVRCLLAVLAQEAALANRPAALAIDLAERALVDTRLLQDQPPESAAHEYARDALVYAGHIDRAEAEAEAAIAIARASGSQAGLVGATFSKMMVLHHRGSVVDLEAEARLTLRIMGTAVEILRPAVVVMLVEALGERGDVLAGLEELERAWEAAASLENVLAFYLLWARGRLRLLTGDVDQAVADLLESGRLQDEQGIISSTLAPWRSSAALALIQQGQSMRAEELVREELELAQTFGAPRPLGVALRAAGLVRGGDDGIDLLEQAVAVLEGSHARLEYARVLADLGTAFCRTNRRVGARAPLTTAIDLALTCGARALAERAHQQLIAAGARPRRLRRTGVDALTPTERRLVHMAAEGLSNPAIAQTLFVSRKNVEMHLVRAYRKLGVTSREQLAEALSSAHLSA